MIESTYLLLIKGFSPFPVELCLTSNIKSRTVPSYDKHHFGFWYSIAHPSVICVSILLLFSPRVALGQTFTN